MSTLAKLAICKSPAYFAKHKQPRPLTDAERDLDRHVRRAAQRRASRKNKNHR